MNPQTVQHYYAVRISELVLGGPREEPGHLIVCRRDSEFCRN